MATTNNKRDYAKLSQLERLVLIGEIWDSIVQDGVPVPLTPSQLQELERREQVARDHPDDEHSAAEVDRMIAQHLAEKHRA